MRSLAISSFFWTTALAALTLNTSDADSIKDAAKSVAVNLISYYDGNDAGNTPGILPKDYAWWEAGAMWDTLINYWHATDDSTYNDLAVQGLLWQVGAGDDFAPANQTASLGNDDQAIWALAAMTAAETNLANPSTDANTQWLALAQHVFDVQSARWDTSSCGGGLRWQVFASNNGYNYKNSISTGALLALAARLARFTGNATYAAWAEQAWTWTASAGLLTAHGAVYDGAHTSTNCTDVNKLQFSLAAAVFAQAAAYMRNHTASVNDTAASAGEVWETRLNTVLSATLDVFFVEPGVPVERPCEPGATCTTDMLAYKGALLRALASVVRLAPEMRDRLTPTLRWSALAAASACGGEGAGSGAQCGFAWTAGKDDGLHGVGQQMNALAALAALLVEQVAPPGTAASGGASGGGGATATATASGGATATASGGVASATVSGAAKSGAGLTADRAGAGFLVAGAVLAAARAALLA